MGRVAVFICAAWLLLSQDRAAAKTQMESKATVHTVITTECSPYFDWQILGLVYRSVPSFFASTVTTRPARCKFLYSRSFLPAFAHETQVKLLAAQFQAGKAAGKLHETSELHRCAAEGLQGVGPGAHACGAQLDNGSQYRTQRSLLGIQQARRCPLLAAGAPSQTIHMLHADHTSNVPTP